MFYISQTASRCFDTGNEINIHEGILYSRQEESRRLIGSVFKNASEEHTKMTAKENNPVAILTPDSVSFFFSSPPIGHDLSGLFSSCSSSDSLGVVIKVLVLP